jgi:hypothetical protein
VADRLERTVRETLGRLQTFLRRAPGLRQLAQLGQVERQVRQIERRPRRGGAAYLGERGSESRDASRNFPWAA